MISDPYNSVEAVTRLRANHSAWKLLGAHNAPLILTFLGDFFITENRGAVGENALTDALDEYLYAIHLVDPDLYPGSPKSYLDDWSTPEHGWLRKFYPAGSDEVHFDATSAVEKAHRWLEGLQTKGFVGTESRLHTLVELLRQIVHGAEEDPQVRLADLENQRRRIDEEIDRVQAGVLNRMEESGLRDRFQLFLSTSRDLMADFRSVEENFRALDRSAREKIAAWDGGKGELLADLVDSRTDISTSDEGRSFQAFHDFLLSHDRQEELAHLLTELLTIEAIPADMDVRTIHHDWAEGAERTQQTVRSLSEQLRTFLEDRVWLENRRVLELIRRIEKSALTLRDSPTKDAPGLTIDEPGIPLALPMARPLHNQKAKITVDSLIEPAVAEDIDLDMLLTQRFVDTARLAKNIRDCIPPRSSVALPEIFALYPLEEGLAELLGYLTLREDDIEIAINREGHMQVDYEYQGEQQRVRLPHVMVIRR